ncbi:hypothetical protein PKOR_20415 [Pontibacter korlensis]|uniref:Uncharacterized protein n=1 Tax=Pontibacter korlensis TaxID=400092 RepID=A0A0E3ZIC8_9BACT|nr:hypothetical protein PKOR_20415 [Pontibacter korlensis]
MPVQRHHELQYGVTSMLKAFILLSVALVFLYYLFYPWLKSTVGRKKLFKWFLILYAVVVLASTVGSYLLD